MAQNENGKQYLLAAGIDNKQLQEGANQAIDIIKGIGDKAVAEGARIDNAYKKVGDSISSELKESIEIQKKVIADLENQYESAKQIFDKVNTGTNDTALIAKRQEASKLYKEVREELNAEKEALTYLEKEYEKISKTEKKATDSKTSYLTQMRKIREEMAQIIDLSNQNGLNYKENERYQELETELQKVATSYRLVQNEQKNLVTAGSQISGIMSGITGVAGAFTAVQGVMSLFIKDNERLAAIQTKLQAAMSITIGLQQVSTTLHQTSAFRMNTVTKVTQLWNIAQKALNVQLGLSVGLSKALMATGIGLLIAGVALLVSKLHEQSKAQDEANKEVEEAKQKQEELAEKLDKMAASYANQISQINALRAAINSENISHDKKLEIIKKLQNIIPGYTAVLDGEGNVIRENKKAIDAYLISLEKSLKFKAAQEELAEIYKEMYKIDTKEKPVSSSTKVTFNGQEVEFTDYDALAQKHGAKNAQDIPADVLKMWKEQEEIFQKMAQDFDDKRVQELKEKVDGINTYIQENGLIDLDTGKTSSNTPNKPKDYTDQLKREEQEKIRFYKDMEFAVRQAEIDASDEGLDKILAQNRLNFDKEMEQVERQKQDKLAKIQAWERTIWESENPDWEKKGMKFSPKTTQLSDKDNEQFKVVETGVEARFTANNQKAYEEALNEYASFAQKYLDKVKEFNNNIKNLEKQGATAETIDGVKTMQAEILAGLDEEMAIKEQTFVTFVEGMVSMGLEQLLEALDRAKDALDAEIASGGGDKAKVNQLKAQVKTLTARINELTAVKDDTKEVKTGDPSKKWKDTLSVMQDVKSLTNDIAGNFEGLDDATKAVLDAAMNIATGVVNMIIGINTLAIGSATATTMTATAAAESIKGVEKASVILAIISAALQIAMAIASVVKNIFSGDKKKEKEIQSLQNQVDALQAAYDKLGREIDKAYSTSAANLIEQQDANLRRQKKLLEEQIRLEEDKKDTDENKVNQYKDAIKEIDNELEKTHDKVIEAIIGQDISSAIDEFAEAYMDAWAAGEDKAASVKDVVRKMVKSAVTELVKSRMSGEVKAFMNYLATAMKDGILTIAEQRTLDALENSIYNKIDRLDDSLDKYIKDEQENEREGSKRGIATASQESVDENNGRLTTIQGHTYSLTENMKILVSNTGAILILLSGIEENTRGIARLESIERDILSMKDTMNDIALKGIIIKR